ncbi:hypothetical protein [Terrabacter sp. Ter38]|uniref:PGN_0703 family putative restriction endonuclease n=1 Tax=Terrabacter sp. Ter38 TaxID=2926030 RepID=UPI002117AB15|nr:hypothetical protein [Terrabacter sp. Ter38]
MESESPRDRSAAVAAHRAHQSDWREKELGWPAGPPTHRGAAKRYPVLGSCLAPEFDGRSAKAEGLNLMSPAAKSYADARLAQLQTLGGLAEDDRLWRNLLSSQPLAFSIAGELREHPAATARVFAALTGQQVASLEDLADTQTPSHDLGGIEAEWFPPRDLHTGDRSGFDIAAYLRLQEGESLLVSVEVKYVDTFSAKKVTWERYATQLASAGLDEGSMTRIVAAGGSQFLRSVLLTDSLRRHGLRRRHEVHRTLAVVLGRQDDRNARKVVQTIAACQPHTPVAYWSHEDFFDACAAQPELARWAGRMQRRYVLAVGKTWTSE